MLWIPEPATNTGALTQQISEVVSVPYVKQMQRLKQKCLLTTVIEVSKRAFELLLYSNLLLTPSIWPPAFRSFHSYVYADEDIFHSPPTALPILSGRKLRSCTIELNLNSTAHKL